MLYQHEHVLAEQWINECNGIVREQFYAKQRLRVYRKPDGTNVTNLDQDVSNYVVAAANNAGMAVLSEEKGSSANHSQNKIFVLDPVDGTNNLIDGQDQLPRVSIAAPSIGFWDADSVVGVVSFPLLGTAPIIYSARVGMGAYRKQQGDSQRLKLDDGPIKGIIFVTIKQNEAAERLITYLKAMGYTPLRIDGSVFKACAVVDSELFKLYPQYRAFDLPAIPVVGYASRGLYLHDVAATTCIIREAGGQATSLKNQAGKQPWVAANNANVYRDLMQAVLS